ncbi:MAG: hypothetical protein IIT37_01195 [Bacteroidales bacterium]|nr:hypothetical protein [Bacteroidales bacterium]
MKKHFTIVSAVITALLMASCGGQTQNQTSGSNTSTQDADTTVQASAPAEEQPKNCNKTADCYKTSGKSKEELYSGSIPLSVAEGDMNNDGVSDLAITETKGENMAIYFGSADGYTLFNTYKVFFATNVTNSVSISEKGVLKFLYQCEDDGYWGSGEHEGDQHYYWHDIRTHSYLLRFQDGDFYLIGGSEYTMRDGFNAQNASIGLSYNFLTNKWTRLVFGKSDNKLFDFKPQPLKKISDFEMGSYEFDDYERSM